MKLVNETYDFLFQNFLKSKPYENCCEYVGYVKNPTPEYFHS